MKPNEINKLLNLKACSKDTFYFLIQTRKIFYSILFSRWNTNLVSQDKVLCVKVQAVWSLPEMEQRKAEPDCEMYSLNLKYNQDLVLCIYII